MGEEGGADSHETTNDARTRAQSTVVYRIDDQVKRLCESFTKKIHFALEIDKCIYEQMKPLQTCVIATGGFVIIVLLIVVIASQKLRWKCIWTIVFVITALYLVVPIVSSGRTILRKIKHYGIFMTDAIMRQTHFNRLTCDGDMAVDNLDVKRIEKAITEHKDMQFLNATQLRPTIPFART